MTHEEKNQLKAFRKLTLSQARTCCGIQRAGHRVLGATNADEIYERKIEAIKKMESKQ